MTKRKPGSKRRVETKPRKKLRGKPPPEGTYGRALWEIRNARGWTESKMAEVLNLSDSKSRSAVHRYVTGVSEPKYSTIVRHCKALGVPIELLFPACDDSSKDPDSKTTKLRAEVIQQVFLMSKTWLQFVFKQNQLVLCKQSHDAKEENGA